MKKRFNLATVLALMLLVCVSTYLMTWQSAQWRTKDYFDNMTKIDQDTARFREARDIILNQFIGESDEEMLTEGALEGMVRALNDNWSYYANKEAYERSKEDKSSVVGIGVDIVQQGGAGGPLIIEEVYASSPAAEAGIAKGDQIIAVDGVPVTDTGEASRLVRGDEYTTVTLTVRRDGEDTEYSLIRRQVVRPLVFSEVIEETLGYIRVQSFDTRVNTDFEEAVKQLQQSGAEGLILDVRDNPGGDVNWMCAMLDFLLPRGRLITLESRDGTQEHKESLASFIDLPIVVLIDKHSYSAAEFFAACLMEYNADGNARAKTVGMPTTGKGYAQQDIPLQSEGGGALHLSIRRYYTPHGVSLAGVGLQPDYPVELDDGAEYRSSASYFSPDKQTEKAVEVLRDMIAG